MGRAFPRQPEQLKSGSRRKEPLIPLHFLWIQDKHPSQKTAYLPTHVRDSFQIFFFRRFRLRPETMSFVFPMFTQRIFLSISAFQVFNLTGSSSMDSTVSYHKSSAYSRTQGQPVRNSLDKSYSTMMKSRGLRTEP